jgi:phosphotransferase system enzyme I (PtsI)
MPEFTRLGERVYHGIAVSGGVCRGKVMVLGHEQESIQRRDIAEAEVVHEIERLEKAMVQTRKQILDVQRQVSVAMGAEEGSIFEAHLMILEDQTLIEEVTRLVHAQKINVEYAFHQVAEKYFATLSAVEDEYLRERAKDMRDVTGRVLNNLTGRVESSTSHPLQEPCIIISEDLSPSTTALFDRKMVLGFATDIGSKTSHTAILARSLRIPAVVGLQNVSHQLKTGQYVLLDGFNGALILNPTDQSLFEYGQLVRKQVDVEEKLRDVKDKTAVSLDGYSVTLSANVEQSADTDSVLASGAEGVGLFRTEYLFITRNTLPSEEEQYQSYRQVAAALKPCPVVIRTLDLGGDKFLSHLQLPPEMNPSLGWRAIRFCLQEKEIFRRQLRAILRASVDGNVKMMYPMISGLEELNQANEVLAQCKAELQAESIPFNADMDVGVMIEVPSAVMIAESLARRVDFFSIGTNDLIQYSLAVDRMNDRIAHLYEPTHPAILNLIKLTVEAAHRHGIWVGVCGEMAGDLDLTALLIGLGVDELSAAPLMVPWLKFLIRRLKASEAKELAAGALQCESPSVILERCRALTRQAAPSLFEKTIA